MLKSSVIILAQAPKFVNPRPANMGPDGPIFVDSLMIKDALPGAVVGPRDGRFRRAAC